MGAPITEEQGQVSASSLPERVQGRRRGKPNSVRLFIASIARKKRPRNPQALRP